MLSSLGIRILGPCSQDAGVARALTLTRSVSISPFDIRVPDSALELAALIFHKLTICPFPRVAIQGDHLAGLDRSSISSWLLKLDSNGVMSGFTGQ